MHLWFYFLFSFSHHITVRFLRVWLDGWLFFLFLTPFLHPSHPLLFLPGGKGFLYSFGSGLLFSLISLSRALGPLKFQWNVQYQEKYWFSAVPFFIFLCSII